MNRLRFLSSSLILIFFSSAIAQFNPSLSINHNYDDNIFKTPEATGDGMLYVNAYLEYLPENSNFSFYYSGTLNFYQQFTDRNTRFNNLGLTYYLPFGIKEEYTFYTGANFLIKNNEEEYLYYDYNQLYAYGNFRFNVSDFIFKTGYNFRYRNYLNYTSISNTRHFFFFQAMRSFSTRTTFQLETDYQLKTFAADDSVGTTISGRGRRTETIYDTFSQPLLSQLVLTAKVAQGITDNSGLSFWYRKQISLTPESVYTNPDTYTQDDELYDDPFSFESDEYNGKFSIILPWSVNLELSAGYADKHYLSENAFISEADTIGSGDLRADQQYYFSLGLEKNINFDYSWLYSVFLYTNYYYLRNESNSYWYNYKSNYITVGLDINF